MENVADIYAGEVQKLLRQLHQIEVAAYDHFGHTPDSVTWADVADIGRIQQLLGEVLAIIKGD